MICAWRERIGLRGRLRFRGGLLGRGGRGGGRRFLRPGSVGFSGVTSFSGFSTFSSLSGSASVSSFSTFSSLSDGSAGPSGGGGGGFLDLCGLVGGQADGPAADDGRLDALLDDFLLALGGKLATDPLDLVVLERAGVGLDAIPRVFSFAMNSLFSIPNSLAVRILSLWTFSKPPKCVVQPGLRPFLKVQALSPAFLVATCAASR
jgi:hypothetical protein